MAVTKTDLEAKAKKPAATKPKPVTKAKKPAATENKTEVTLPQGHGLKKFDKFKTK